MQAQREIARDDVSFRNNVDSLKEVLSQRDVEVKKLSIENVCIRLHGPKGIVILINVCPTNSGRSMNNASDLRPSWSSNRKSR